MLLRAVGEIDAEMRQSQRGPFDGAQARKLLELTHRACGRYGWTHEQLQALAEGYSAEAEVSPLLTSAWDTWAGLLPRTERDADEGADDEDSGMMDTWLQCQEDVEAAADALGHGRLLEARELLSYALSTWEEGALSAPGDAANAASGAGTRMSAAQTATKEYVVHGYCLRADCAALEAQDESDATGDAAAAGALPGSVLSAEARADLEAALSLDPSCSAAHLRLARSALASVATASSSSSSRSSREDDGTSNVDEAAAARAARLARLQAASAPVSSSTAAAMPASEGLVHAVGGVVIGSEQLPELVELVDMVEALSKGAFFQTYGSVFHTHRRILTTTVLLSKAAGKEAAAELWAKKDPRGLPPSWVLASYFDSFGRWLLHPAVRFFHTYGSVFTRIVA